MIQDTKQKVIIDYTNYRGERRIRTIYPKKIVFTGTPEHVQPQWILIAFDEQKQALRSFAMNKIHSWRIE